VGRSGASAVCFSLSVVVILTTTSLKETGFFELTTGGYQKPQNRGVDHSGE
jgi:hypothetical protein